MLQRSDVYVFACARVAMCPAARLAALMQQTLQLHLKLPF